MSLVAWYPLNGDLKNNGNSDFDLKNSGATIEDNGKIGKCYYFNGSNSKLYGKLDISSMNYGIAIWVKFSQIISETQWVFCLNDNASNADVQLGIFVNSLGFNLYGIGSNNNILYNYDIQTDIWYHIVLTADGEKMRFYLNGEFISEYDIELEVIKHNFTLGARSNNSEGAGVNSAYHLKGYINDIRIYDHCLSDAEVKEISKGLVLHYTMDKVYEENKVYDSSGYGNDGVSTNIKYVTDNRRGVTSAAFESDNQSAILFNNTLSKTWEISCGCWVYKNDWNTFSGEEAIVAFTSNKGIHFNIKNESQALGTKASIFIYDEDIQKSRFFQCETGTDYMHILSNGWHHIFMTSSESQLKLYIDGKIVTATSKIETYDINFNRTSYIGRISDTGFFNGKIDDFRIYTTTLSDRDVLQLYRETQKIDNKGNLYCSELNEVERRVEYLESTGTQYIDTGIIPNQDTRLVIKFLSTPSANQSLFGARKKYETNNYSFWTRVDETLTRDSYGSNSHINWDIIDFSQGAIIDKNKKDITIIMNLGEKYFQERTYTQTFNCGVNLYLGTTNNNGSTMNFFVGKIYYCKIWDNDTLVRDFLPIISTEEGHIGEACLFDTVENKYYYNQGTGKFATNLDESTTNIDFTNKGIVNTDYIIEGKEQAKIKNDGNIIEVNNIYEN